VISKDLESPLEENKAVLWRQLIGKEAQLRQAQERIRTLEEVKGRSFFSPRSILALAKRWAFQRMRTTGSLLIGLSLRFPIPDRMRSGLIGVTPRRIIHFVRRVSAARQRVTVSHLATSDPVFEHQQKFQMLDRYCFDQPGKIAVHLHLFYADLINEFCEALRNIPYAYDLFVSIPDNLDFHSIDRTLKAHSGAVLVTVKAVTNRGRDIAPMLVNFREDLAGYDFLLHIHSKKSLYAGGTMLGWREYLLSSLVGSRRTVAQIFGAFEADQDLGMMFPKSYESMPYWGHTWLSNVAHGSRLCKKMGIQWVNHYFNYPAGSMFWARVDALRPLFAENWKIDDFEPEHGQTDGTFAHSIERCLGLLPEAQGYRSQIFETHDDGKKSQLIVARSPANLEQYFSRGSEAFRAALQSGVKVVSFDIFDTLIERPVLQPATVFDLTAKKLATRLKLPGHFASLRVAVDSELRCASLARQHDPNIFEIYDEIGARCGWSEDDCRWAAEVEIELERRLLRQRTSVIELFHQAVRSGCRVVLASDMYLPKAVLEQILSGLGVSGYSEIYVSCDLGLRKDARSLFPHLLQRENLKPSELLHVGDNEHSDVQTAVDLGIQTFHVMSGRTLLSLNHSFRRIRASESNSSINDSIHWGLISRRLFSRFNPDRYIFENLYTGRPEDFGYVFLGPLVLEFSVWLRRMAKSKNIRQLHFLARDGEILKKAFDYLERLDPLGAHSNYLLLSRRAVASAFIKNVDDILQIIDSDPFGGPLKELFYFRLGLDIDGPEFHSSLERAGFDSADERVEIARDKSRIHELVRLIGERVLDNAKIEATGLLKYLKQEGLFSDEPKALVDIGYSGTNQLRLNQLSGTSFLGFYFATSEKAKVKVPNAARVMWGFLANFASIEAPTVPFLKHQLFFEMFFSSTQGQIQYFKDSDDGLLPVFGEVRGEPKKLAILPEVHRGVLQYIEDFSQFFDEDDLDEGPSEMVQRLPVDLLENPAMNLVPLFNGMTVDDHYCGNGLFYLLPEIKGEYFAEDQLQRSIWHRFFESADLGPEA
jgi:FMN phosphatase YigB (HAD superfamily)